MDQALGVRGREAFTDLNEHLHVLSPRRPGLLSHPVLERSPLDQLHGHERLPSHRVGLVDLHDVGVRELGHGLGLAEQASGVLLVELLEQHLDRDLAIERAIEGLEDHPHPPLTQRTQHHVAAERLGGRGNLE